LELFDVHELPKVSTLSIVYTDTYIGCNAVARENTPIAKLINNDIIVEKPNFGMIIALQNSTKLWSALMLADSSSFVL
jgi:hypothetical protein